MLASRLATGLAVLLALPAASPAQTILNTERFQIEEVEAHHLSAEISLSLQRGNARVLNASTSGVLGTLADRHWPRIIFGGRYLSTEASSLLDAQFLQLRYSYIFSPRARTFHFLQAQKNQTLLLRNRWLLGSGLRATVMRTELATIALGSGLMSEWEVLDPSQLEADEDPRTHALRMANLLVLSWQPAGGARLLNILYVQPDLSRFGDVRILNDFGIAAPLTDRLRSTISLEWRRDSRPPAALAKDDLRLAAGLALEIP